MREAELSQRIWSYFRRESCNLRRFLPSTSFALSIMVSFVRSWLPNVSLNSLLTGGDDRYSPCYVMPRPRRFTPVTTTVAVPSRPDDYRTISGFCSFYFLIFGGSLCSV